MNKIEKLKATGEVLIQKTKADGSMETIKHHNLVVTDGLEWIASRMVDAGSPDQMSHMAIGTGTADPVAGDTQLGTQVHRNALDSQSVSGRVVTYVAEFLAGDGVGAITEAGIFNAASNGTMLCRTEFPVVTKESGDSITITWSVTIGAA